MDSISSTGGAHNGMSPMEAQEAARKAEEAYNNQERLNIGLSHNMAYLQQENEANAAVEELTKGFQNIMETLKSTGEKVRQG